MVAAWPHLLSLRINLGTSIPMPTLGAFQRLAPSFPQRAMRTCGLHAQSLLAIARACPKLRELTILCDLSELTLPSPEDCPASPHTLQVIKLISMLPGISAKDAEHIARLIDLIA